jgi:hypothetical protein
MLHEHFNWHKLSGGLQAMRDLLRRPLASQEIGCSSEIGEMYFRTATSRRKTMRTPNPDHNREPSTKTLLPIQETGHQWIVETSVYTTALRASTTKFEKRLYFRGNRRFAIEMAIVEGQIINI